MSDMFFQNHIRHFYDVLASYIELRIDDGAFQPVEPLVAARAFMGMLIYHRLLTVLFQVPVIQEPRDIVQTFVTVFMNGLKTPVKPGEEQETSNSWIKGIQENTAFMNYVALKMLFGDRAKYMMLLAGLTFSTMLIVQQGSIFWGLMTWSKSGITNIHASCVGDRSQH